MRLALADDRRDREPVSHVLDVLVRLELARESVAMPADDRAGRVVEVPPVPAVVSLDQEPKRLQRRVSDRVEDGP